MDKEALLESLQMMASRNDVIRDTHGNVSCLDYSKRILYIKPSGMEYSQITLDDICEIDYLTGKPIGKLKRKPSVDLEHHMEIYSNNPWVTAICHTHSPYAVAHAVSCAEVPCLTTEQADYFGGDIPVLPYADLHSWGKKVLLEQEWSAVLLAHHGALTFSDDPTSAVKLAIALEEICLKNYLAQTLYSIPHNVKQLNRKEIQAWRDRYENVYGQR